MVEQIVLRPALMGDADMLLAWRNDPATRRASHNMTEVQRRDHIDWLQATLDNELRKLYVAECQGEAIGTVRSDMIDGVWELSWTISPQARGRGLAKRMVAVLAKQISAPISAEVKTGNIASARIAEYAGMKLEKEVDGVLYYKRHSF